MTAALILVVARLAAVHRDPRAPPGAAPARAQERRPTAARSGSRRARLAARRGDHHRIRRGRRHDGRVDQAGRPHAPRPDRRARHASGVPPSRRSSSGCCGRSSRETSTASSRSRRSRPQSPAPGPRVRTAPRSQLLSVDFEQARAFGGDAEATGIIGRHARGRSRRDHRRRRSRARGRCRADGSPSTRTGSGPSLVVDRVLPRRGVAGFWLGPEQEAHNVARLAEDVRLHPSRRRQEATRRPGASRSPTAAASRTERLLTDEVSAQIRAAAAAAGLDAPDLPGEAGRRSMWPRRWGRDSRRCSPRWGASACSPACCCS